MVYFCNMKSSGWRVATIRKDGKKVNVLYIVDRNHQISVVVVDHSRSFKGIQPMVVTMEKYLIIQEEEIIEKKES